MRLASWSWGGRDHAGTVSADGREVTPLALADASRGALPLIQMLARGEPLPSPSGARLPVSAVRLNAPLPKPLRGIFCAGRNYRDHAAELATSVFSGSLPQKDEWAIVFTKVAESVIGPHDTVRLPPPSVTTQIDYESELAVVIGRGGRDIPRSRALEHVFGYTIVNDVSARDVQVRHQQWDLGKSFDTFCPMGPWIVGIDELDGGNTRMRGWLIPRGGAPELRQDFLDKLKVFVWEKEFIGAGGLTVTDEIRVVVAATAVQLIVHLNLSYYDRLSEIIVYPGAFKLPDRTGAVLGEARSWGTVVLSWARPGSGSARKHGSPRTRSSGSTSPLRCRTTTEPMTDPSCAGTSSSTSAQNRNRTPRAWSTW